ncbi:uncharacterized [Tachysurus ichikawai]
MCRCRGFGLSPLISCDLIRSWGKREMNVIGLPAELRLSHLSRSVPSHHAGGRSPQRSSEFYFPEGQSVLQRAEPTGQLTSSLK